MALFNGCTSLVLDEGTEFVVNGGTSRYSGGLWGGPQAVGPQGPLGAQLRSGSLEGTLGAPRGPQVALDPQKIGRVLTVAVSELGEHVKSGL